MFISLKVISVKVFKISQWMYFAIVCILCANISSVHAKIIDFENWKLPENMKLIKAAKSDNAIGFEYKASDYAPMMIRPNKPIDLPKSTTRLDCWFGLAAGDCDLSFEIADASGKTHQLKVETSRMTSRHVLWNSSRRTEWSIWNQATTNYLRQTIEPDLVQRIPKDRIAYVRTGIWPLPWKLTGIQIKPCKPGKYARWHAPGSFDLVKQGCGELWIANLRAEDKNAFESDTYWLLAGRIRDGKDIKPFLFIDDLTQNKDEVRYQVQVHKGYMGPVVWQTQKTTELPTDDAMELYRQRIELPMLPEGRYFIHTKTWNLDGTLDRQQILMPLYMVQNTQAKPLDQSIDNFTFQTAQADHVYPKTTRLAVLTLQLPDSTQTHLSAQTTCYVSIVDRKQQVVVQQNFDPANSIQINVPVQDGEDYFAMAELRHDKQVYDRTHLHFGVANDLATQTTESIPQSVPNRDGFLNQHVGITGESWYGIRDRTYPWFCDYKIDAFEKWAKIISESGGDTISVGDSWGSHEILPGVYQWQEMQDQINIAKKYGLRVIFGYSADGAAMGGSEQPYWLNVPLQRDQYGKVARRQFPRPTYWDASYQSGYAGFYQRMARQFRLNTNVLGYRIHSHLIPSNGYTEVRYDYSQPAQAEFGKWTKQQGTGGMKMIDPILLHGIPVVSAGPDLTPQWLQFMQFNSHTITQSIRHLMQAIRSVDDRRMVLVDQKPFAHAIESVIPFLKDGGVLKNEDSPSFRAAILKSMCVQAGVPYVEELHNHLPTSRAIADVTDFWSSYLSDTIFWLIRGHAGFLRDKLPSNIGSHQQVIEKQMMTYLKQSRPHWQQWIHAKQQQPQLLVFGSRAQGLIWDRRMGCEYDIAGLATFRALFSSHQLPVHFADEYTDWVDLSRFKLVFVCGKVQTQHAVDRLVDYASKGGKLVIVDKAGRYVVQSSQSDKSLLEQLKNLPNVRVIDKPKQLPSKDWMSTTVFPQQQIHDLMSWAGVEKTLRVESEGKNGFECQRRDDLENQCIYVAVMRRWNRWYAGNIERQDVLEKKFGTEAGRVILTDMPSKQWKIEQFHREYKDMGIQSVVNGQITFNFSEVTAGEVLLFKLTSQ